MAADNVRHIEVFISRLNPATTAEDVESLAEASVASDDVVKYKVFLFILFIYSTGIEDPV